MIVKNHTIQELKDKIKAIELDLKNNFSAWGDASDYARKRTIRQLTYIRSQLNKPHKIKFYSKNKTK